MHQAVGGAAIRALAVSRKSIEDIQPLLEPFPRGAQLDLHLDVLVARVEEMVHLPGRHRGALAGRQHHPARRRGVDADGAFLGGEGFRVGAVPVGYVLPARRDGHGQKRVFAAGLAPVFFENGPVFGEWVPDLSTGVVEHSRWHPGDIVSSIVAGEFENHIANAYDKRSGFD